MTTNQSYWKNWNRRSKIGFVLAFSLATAAAAAVCTFLMFPRESAHAISRVTTALTHRAPAAPAAPAPQLDPTAFDGKRALDEAGRFLAIGPRNAGTEGALRGATYLSDRLKALGLDPLIDEFKDATPVGETTFRNVVAEIPGTGETQIIITSHYDTKSGISTNFVGANDSGSSTGILLELANLLKRQTYRGVPTILLAFLDGEECMKDYGPTDGLHGSRHLANLLVKNARAGKVTAVIVIDMVGDNNLAVTIPRNSSAELASTVFAAATEQNTRLKFSFAEGAILDDHVPFLNAGMPAIDLIDFDYGSAPGLNDYWHTAQDTFDKLNADSLQIVGRVLVSTLNKLQ